MPTMPSDPTAEVTDLLQQLIRNACVNDGTPESGHESRSVDLLAQYLGDTGLDLERYVAQPGRENLVARIEGSDPTAPALLLMGHTDVVPANPDGWRRDPFGGEVVDGEVWGRGAVDMLNLTATMAVAFRALARSGFPSPRRAKRPRSSTSPSIAPWRTANGSKWAPVAGARCTCPGTRAATSAWWKKAAARWSRATWSREWAR